MLWRSRLLQLPPGIRFWVQYLNGTIYPFNVSPLYG
jgi:hypothetical protein